MSSSTSTPSPAPPSSTSSSSAASSTTSNTSNNSNTSESGDESGGSSATFKYGGDDESNGGLLFDPDILPETPGKFLLAVGEGDWGDFRFKRIQPADWGKVLKHLQDVTMKDEPTCQLLGYSNDFGDDMEKVVKPMLSDCLSLLVEHRKTSEVAGVQVNYRSTPHSNMESGVGLNISSYAGKVLLRLLDILKKMSNLFEAYEVDQVGEIFITSTSPKYRQKGVSKELFQRSLSLLKDEGFRAVAIKVTNPHVGEVAKAQFGFTEACRLEYKEFIDELGQPVFNPDELTDDPYASVMAKAI